MNRTKSKTLKRILGAALAIGLLLIWLPSAALANGPDSAMPIDAGVVADPANPDAGDTSQDPDAVLEQLGVQTEAVQITEEVEGDGCVDDAAGLAAMQQTRMVEPSAYLVVEKVWDDDDDALGLRPSSVTVNVYFEGAFYDSIVLDDSNGWVNGFVIGSCYATWSDYTVEELAVPNYVTGVTSETGEAGPYFIITNTINPPMEDELITVTIIKKWEDNNNAKGTRPSSVEVELYRDGILINTVVLDESNNWTRIIEGLPLYQDNDPDALSVYAVKEVSVDGYKVEITAESLDMGVEFTIVNTIIPPDSTPVKGTPIAKTSDSLMGLIIGLVALGAAGAGTAVYGLRRRNER